MRQHRQSCRHFCNANARYDEATYKTDDNVDTFCYNLGRLIYLLDAVDDVEKDSKSGEYNPLVLNYGKCAEKKDYLAKTQTNCRFAQFNL